MKEPKCTHCGELGHYQSFCRKKPRKPLPRQTKPITVTKLPNKIGKQGKRTASAVAKWKRTQKPNDAGYFECYMCHRWLTYLTAEHVKSKARHPDLRADPTNFAPTCDDCNRRKGSNDN